MLKKKPIIYLTLLSILAVLISVSFVSAAVEVDTSELRDAVTVDAVREHQQAFQDIADANGGTRASSTPGYDASVDYVVSQLDTNYFDVTIQEFSFPYFEELATPVMDQTAPNVVSYVPNVDFFTMEYSGSGDVTAEVVVPNNFGCDPADFDNADYTGKIALILRGVCNFSVKAINAEAAGAVGAIVFNDEARQVPFLGTLGGVVGTIPVVGTSYTIGQELAGNNATVHLVVSTFVETRTTSNIIANTKEGRTDRVVVVGAHLDSVAEGPGIQDNGSGSAAILEIAQEMAELGIEPTNQVRFAWWGAEESGLLGSEYYVSQLSARQIKNIAVNLNFDMVGSPNFVRFVYDGDGSATPLAGPNGSKNVESVFLEYFGEQGLATEPTAFDGRSDYGPFIAVGIPAGGLFTGAEGIKTAGEAGIYGGTAGQAYDPCYHQACDTFDNISLEALDQMSDAAAHAVLTFAETTSAVNGTDKGKGNGKWEDGMEHQGSHLKK